MHSIPLNVAVIVLAALVLGCGTAGKPAAAEPAHAERLPNRETGGGLWEQLRESRVAKDKRMQAQAHDLERTESERSRVPAELRTKLETWWHEFVNLDPTWMDSRERWRKEGAQAKNLLIENLIILMVRSYDVGNGILYKRACGELAEWSALSTPYLVQGLASESSDEVVRQHCAKVLGMIGVGALPQIRAGYDDAGDSKVRLHLVRAAREMSAPEAVDFLIDVVERESDFRLRITAIEGLGKALDPRALPVLIACLRADDVSVRKFAGGYLGGFGAKSAVDPLIACMRDAEAKALLDANEAEVASNCSSSLRFITKQKFSRANQWEAWWQRNKSRF
jgi:hypothetical protein